MKTYTLTLGYKENGRLVSEIKFYNVYNLEWMKYERTKALYFIGSPGDENKEQEVFIYDQKQIDYFYID